MSPSRSSLRNRTLAIAVLVAAALLAPLPAALAWPAGTCEPAKDKNCVVDVAIAKTSDRAEYAPGDVVAYTITVTNTGNTAVLRERIAVSDPSLGDLAPTGATTGWLSPGQTYVWTGTRTLTAAECGELPNTATVSLTPSKGDLPDSDAGNDTATRTVTVGGEGCAAPAAVVPIVQAPAATPVTTTNAAVCPRPTLAAVVRGPRNPKAGERAVYHVTVTSAKARADRVQVRVSIPRDFYVPGSLASARVRGGDLVFALRPLKAGGARTIRLPLRLTRTARAPRTLAVSVSAHCGGAAATARTVSPVAVSPAVVQPAVAG